MQAPDKTMDQQRKKMPNRNVESKNNTENELIVKLSWRNCVERDDRVNRNDDD